MQAARVPAALRERLGVEAASGLVELVEETGREWRDDLLKTATERFGRMLADETAKSRVEVATEIDKFRAEVGTEFGKLRAESAAEFGTVRTELAAEFAKVRAESAAEFGTVRTEFAAEFAKVRIDMANWRADLLKWTFLFWVGQLAAIAGLMAFMLRNVGR